MKDVTLDALVRLKRPFHLAQDFYLDTLPVTWLREELLESIAADLATKTIEYRR